MRSLLGAYDTGRLSTGTLEVRLDEVRPGRSVDEIRRLLADVGRMARLRLTVAELLTAHRRHQAPTAAALNVRLPGLSSPPRLTLGRHPNCDVVIADTTVSRYHASLRREAGRWIVHDLGSRNGTWLNGRKASRVEVKPGDELRLGGLVARLI